MSKIVTTGKLNRLWTNGILPRINNINVCGLNGNTYATLKDFVNATATRPNLIGSMFRFKDSGKWGPLGTATWYRCVVIYQNAYATGGTYSVTGNGFMMTDDNKMYQFTITGTKDANNLAISYKLLGSSTNLISSYNDLMANSVAGYAPDALAVKQGFTKVNDSLGGLKFGKNGDGNYGYYGADGSLIPFKSFNGSPKRIFLRTSLATANSETVTITDDCIAEYWVNCKVGIINSVYKNNELCFQTTDGNGGTAAETDTGIKNYIEFKKGDIVYISITGSKHDSMAVLTYMG